MRLQYESSSKLSVCPQGIYNRCRRETTRKRVSIRKTHPLDCRVSSANRWKIEALCVYNAAGEVVCGDPHLYPIKHVTNKCLIANESCLEVLTLG